MGNDGGSIPKRIELVKEKQKEVRPDRTALKIATWFFCALSKRLLQEPIVSCALGKLYNKDAIIEYLLNKSAYGDGDIICSHISSLKDVKTLNLTVNPAFKESSAASIAHFDQEMVSRFICPITRKEMNGKSKFVYLNKCGCVFSEQGLKEIPSETYSLNEKSTTSPPNDNKRKMDDDNLNSQPSKKIGIEQSNICASNAIVNQKVQEHLASTYTKAKQSKAIQSIYSDKKKDDKIAKSYLVRGTFNRYAA
ncbi:647_t:CDS:2 [Diversispora eburnea]|uniref:647_t:CDS:1 n=1 Tax=Diversispora eburnea TaxID=1213867 RepID=A0A9N8ZI84_9GLOM|nr:647_t:CDS:2 [Diversispora eburnea]